MKIGIIDTGVDVRHYRFERMKIECIGLMEDDGGSISTCMEAGDDEGHGTGIASIILHHAPAASLKAVKLTGWNKKISEQLLAAAINLLTDDEEIRIINISMGIRTNHPSVELRQICEKAAKKGVVIAASAYYLYNEWCYPAHFNTVFGVGQGIVRTKHEFRFMENKWADILAKGGFQRVPVPGNGFKFSTGTSLATAHFTGIISKSHLNGEWTDPASLREWLRTNSVSSVISFTGHDQPMGNQERQDSGNITPAEVFSSLNMPDCMKKVAIFPFEEKEMRTVLEFAGNLARELTLAVSYPRPLKLEQSIGLLQEKNIPYTLQKLTEEQFDTFDTLVVGYFLDKADDQNAYYGYHLIRECVQRGKHFLVWDRVAHKLIQSVADEAGDAYNGTIYLAGFNADDQARLLQAVDNTEVTTPSICVIGTSKKQGKFTTQMIIKELLQDAGYLVGHISTEPQGIILGADLTFPIGHNDTVKIDLKNWNRTLKRLQLLLAAIKSPDIIISGGQGGIIPRHPVYDDDPPEKLSYVKAFYPDALICSISPNDDIAFINKTKDVVSSFVNSRILFYVLTPWEFNFHHGNNSSVMTYQKISAEAYNERLAFYNNALDAPVFDIMNRNDHPELLRIILQFFSPNKTEA